MILWRMPVGIHGKPKGEQVRNLPNRKIGFLITLVAIDFVTNADGTTC
jgi:hypothetical protein